MKRRQSNAATIGHGIAILDDSGISSVALCQCGESFLGTGDQRRQIAAHAHAQHVWVVQTNAREEREGGVMGRPLRPQPTWADFAGRAVRTRGEAA